MKDEPTRRGALSESRRAHFDMGNSFSRRSLGLSILAAAALAAYSSTNPGCSCDTPEPPPAAKPTLPERPPGRPGTRWIAELPEEDPACLQVNGPWKCEGVFPQVIPDDPLPKALRRFVAFTWTDTAEGKLTLPPDSEIDNLKSQLASMGITSLQMDQILLAPQGQGEAFSRESKRWLRQEIHSQAGGMPHLPAGTDQRAGVDVFLIDSAPTTGNVLSGDAHHWGRLEHGRILFSVLADLLCPQRLEGNSAAGCMSNIFTELALPQLTDLIADESTGGYFGQESRLAAAIVSAVEKWRIRAKNDFDNETSEHVHAVLNLSIGREPAKGECEIGIEPAPENAASRSVLVALRYAACFDVDRIAAAGNRAGFAPEPTCPAAWESLPAPTKEECEDLLDPGDTDYLPYLSEPPAGLAPGRLVTAVYGLDHGGQPILQTRRMRPRLAAIGALAPDEGVSEGNNEPETAPISGTSVAAVVMTAAVALARSYAPELNGTEIMKAIYDSGYPTEKDGQPEVAEVCYDSSCEIRRADVCATVAAVCASGLLGEAQERCPSYGIMCRPPPESSAARQQLPRSLAREMIRSLGSMEATPEIPIQPVEVSLENAFDADDDGLVRTDDGDWIRPQPSRPPCNPCIVRAPDPSEVSNPAEIYVNLDPEYPAEFQLLNTKLFLVGATAGSALQYDLSATAGSQLRTAGMLGVDVEATSGRFKIDIPDGFEVRSALLVWDVHYADASEGTMQALRSTARQQVMVHRANDACDANVSVGSGGKGMGAIYGEVVDVISDVNAANPKPVKAASVEMDGEQYSVNESGAFSIAGVEGNTRSRLVVTAEGYAPTVRPLETSGGNAIYTKVAMVPWCPPTNFQTDDLPVTLTCDGGASVTLPAGAIDAPACAGPTDSSGNICPVFTIMLAHVDAAKSNAIRAYPGDFRTLDGRAIEAYGMIHVDVRDSSSGVSVGLKSGMTVTASVPVLSDTPSTRDLYHFHDMAARWSFEGSSACSSQKCEMHLPEFGAWTTASVIETACVHACVSSPLSSSTEGVIIEANGVDYNAVTSEVTGADGCACLDVKKGKQANLVAWAAIESANSIAFNSAGANSCAACNCQELGETFKVLPPEAVFQLTWSAKPTDLDLHLTGPCDPSECATGRFHISFTNFGHLMAAPFAVLNTDDTIGYGREIITASKCMPGIYQVAVHNFSGEINIADSKANVSLSFSNQSVTQTVPTVNAANLPVWVVGQLTCDGMCNCLFAESNIFKPDGEASYHP